MVLFMNLKNGIKISYLQNKNRRTEIENKLMFTKGEGINYENNCEIIVRMTYKHTTVCKINR